MSGSSTPGFSALAGAKDAGALIDQQHEKKLERELEQRSRVDGYLNGQPQVFREIDEWIRGELRRSYPSLDREHADLCQTVHEKLLVKLRAGAYRGTSALRTYVTGIAHHTALDRMRKRYRDRALRDFLSSEPPADDPPNPYKLQRNAENHVLLRQVLLNLPARCQRLWYLVFIERLPRDRVADRLGIPEGTLKSRLWNCRRIAVEAMRRLLSGDREERGAG
ncbi:hypothetical protein ABI59_12800 [Acidobacteria bacterium Mor1]|nr:hypothetical protein ABI59_12800 [Acidobacteria bacterium Mor1]